jgi:hypothetical protein
MVYVPSHLRRRYAERLLEEVVAPGGYLIACSYGGCAAHQDGLPTGLTFVGGTGSRAQYQIQPVQAIAYLTSSSGLKWGLTEVSALSGRYQNEDKFKNSKFLFRLDGSISRKTRCFPKNGWKLAAANHAVSFGEGLDRHGRA